MKHRLTSQLSARRVLIIDQHDVWRERSARDLCWAGYCAIASGNYQYPLQTPRVAGGEPASAAHGRRFDLALLGCVRIGEMELALIRRAQQLRQCLLVMPTCFSGEEMRRAFLAGARDVVSKPYDATQLIALVDQAFDDQRIVGYYNRAVREEEPWPVRNEC